MCYLNAIKLGFSIVAALSGIPKASPAEVAVALLSKAKKTTPKSAISSTVVHCEVCHQANLRALAA